MMHVNMSGSDSRKRFGRWRPAFTSFFFLYSNLPIEVQKKESVEAAEKSKAEREMGVGRCRGGANATKMIFG